MKISSAIPLFCGARKQTLKQQTVYFSSMSGTLDYSSWLVEINNTNKHYRELFFNAVPFPPIFFFGNPENAVAATLGVNPSAQEFSLNRK